MESPNWHQKYAAKCSLAIGSQPSKAWGSGVALAGPKELAGGVCMGEEPSNKKFCSTCIAMSRSKKEFPVMTFVVDMLHDRVDSTHKVCYPTDYQKNNAELHSSVVTL